MMWRVSGLQTRGIGEGDYVGVGLDCNVGRCHEGCDVCGSVYVSLVGMRVVGQETRVVTRGLVWDASGAEGR